MQPRDKSIECGAVLELATAVCRFLHAIEIYSKVDIVNRQLEDLREH